MLREGSRRYFWWRSIAKPTYLALALIWIAFSNAATFRDNFLSKATQGHWQTLDLLPKWGWRGFLLGLFVIASVAMCEGTYRLYREERNGRLAAELKLKCIEDARPRLVPRYPNPVYVTFIPWRNRENGQVIFSTWVARVAVLNNPPTPYTTSAARNVVAFIGITHDGNLLEMDGRWADSDQPATRPHGLSRTDLLETGFNIGASHELDLIMKYEDGECFGLNNDNSNFPGQKNPAHKLRGSVFHVQVRLRGPMIDESFAFEVRSVPSGLEVTQPQ
jgi:hypothetical protein